MHSEYSVLVEEFPVHIELEVPVADPGFPSRGLGWGGGGRQPQWGWGSTRPKFSRVVPPLSPLEI